MEKGICSSSAGMNQSPLAWEKPSCLAPWNRLPPVSSTRQIKISVYLQTHFWSKKALIFSFHGHLFPATYRRRGFIRGADRLDIKLKRGVDAGRVVHLLPVQIEKRIESSFLLFLPPCPSSRNPAAQLSEIDQNERQIYRGVTRGSRTRWRDFQEGKREEAAETEIRYIIHFE